MINKTIDTKATQVKLNNNNYQTIIIINYIICDCFVNALLQNINN